MSSLLCIRTVAWREGLKLAWMKWLVAEGSEKATVDGNSNALVKFIHQWNFNSCWGSTKKKPMHKEQHAIAKLLFINSNRAHTHTHNAHINHTHTQSRLFLRRKNRVPHTSPNIISNKNKSIAHKQQQPAHRSKRHLSVKFDFPTSHMHTSTYTHTHTCQTERTYVRPI